ncbi:uncharacterized protein LOC108667873 isoform X2 [Hyalella azteca]|uniref:Uncharacterized protein LOC108667873 isoform X2 n=1 Tax=Hyalella azteca TaxID=294128 RepID=A0A8B7NA54_HYAAZ|nr:uncharacterized protein LOC108667873 isoform X2 [Hyalella azteca]
MPRGRNRRAVKSVTAKSANNEKSSQKKSSLKKVLRLDGLSATQTLPKGISISSVSQDTSSPSSAASLENSEDEQQSFTGFTSGLPAHLLKSISVSGASVTSLIAKPTESNTEREDSVDFAQQWLKKRQQQLQVKRARESEDELDDEEYYERDNSKQGNSSPNLQQEKQEELIRRIKQQNLAAKEESKVSTNDLLLKYSGITLSNAGSSIAGTESSSIIKPESSSIKSSSNSVSISGGTAGISLPAGLGCSISFKSVTDSKSKDFESEEESDLDELDNNSSYLPELKQTTANANTRIEAFKDLNSSVTFSNSSVGSASISSDSISRFRASDLIAEQSRIIPSVSSLIGSSSISIEPSTSFSKESTFTITDTDSVSNSVQSSRRCLECNAVFENGAKLRLHILSSHSARPASSDVASSVAESSTGDKDNVRPCVTKPAHFIKCSVCHLPFTNTYYLQKHRIEVHSLPKPSNNGESDEAVPRVKPRPFKLVWRCRRCSIKRFSTFRLFESHHLAHIKAVNAGIRLEKLSPAEVQKFTGVGPKVKKQLTGRKKGRKPNVKRAKGYDSDADFTVAGAKLKLTITQPREGSNRRNKRSSFFTSAMSHLLADSDGEGFEGEFEEDLPDLHTLPTGRALPSAANKSLDSLSGPTSGQEFMRIEASEGTEQYNKTREESPGGTHTGEAGTPDEGFDDNPDDPESIGSVPETSMGHSDSSNFGDETSAGAGAADARQQSPVYDDSGNLQSEHITDKSSGNGEFDNAFNNPANLNFDNESEGERPPSTYQPQFESFTGDWFQEYESGPRIAAAMAGTGAEGESSENSKWAEGNHVNEPEASQEITESGELQESEGTQQRPTDRNGLFSQAVLGNENSAAGGNGRGVSGGSFEQLCLNDSFNQDQQSQNERTTEVIQESHAEGGQQDLLSELEYLNRGGQSTNDSGLSGDNSRDSQSSHVNTSRPGSNSSCQSGGHPTPPPDTSFRSLASSPLQAPNSPSIGSSVLSGGTTSPMQGVSLAQTSSSHLAGASQMVGSPHIAGSPHMTGSPHMGGSPSLGGSPRSMTGSPHLAGSPQLAGSPLSQTQSLQNQLQTPPEARLTIANNLMASSGLNGNIPNLATSTSLLTNTFNQWPSVATTSSYSGSFLSSNGFDGAMRAPMPPGVSVPYRPSPPPRVRGRPPLIGHGGRPPTMRGPGRPLGSSILPPPLMPAPGGRGSMMPSLTRLPGYNSQPRGGSHMSGQKRHLPGQQTGLSPSKSQRRDDINVPSRQKDNECQIIAVANRGDGLPVISNVQGGREERRQSQPTGNGGGGVGSGESTIHLSDSITLSVRSSSANKEPARGERSGDAGTVANLLASRGITVTPAAGDKNDGGRDERRIPTASDLNLSSAISVHPPTSRDRDGFAVPQAPSTRNISSNREIERPPRPPTVDLTRDVNPTGAQPNRVKCSQCDRSFSNQALLADHAKVHQQASSARMPYKCHLCTAGFSTQKGQQHHYQQFHQLHLSTNDVAIPVVDLRNPVNVQRMAALGVRSFLPLTNLQNRGGGGIVGIPLLTLENLRNGQMTLQQWGVNDVLTLGPPKTLNMPR